VRLQEDYKNNKRSSEPYAKVKKKRKEKKWVVSYSQLIHKKKSRETNKQTVSGLTTLHLSVRLEWRIGEGILQEHDSFTLLMSCTVADARCGIRGAKTMEMLICIKI
jgi:hypothetical protein